MLHLNLIPVAPWGTYTVHTSGLESLGVSGVKRTSQRLENTRTIFDWSSQSVQKELRWTSIGETTFAM